MNPHSIYLDNHSTTKLDPEVFEAMQPWLMDNYGNASSIHSFGQEAADAVEESRSKIAELLNCSPVEVIFTSGATESIHLAINGVIDPQSSSNYHVISSDSEHSAVFWCVRNLIFCKYGKNADSITQVGTETSGLVNINQIEKAIRENTKLVSIIYVNNETGVIQDVHRIQEICEKHDVLFHTDATQAVGKMPINFKESKFDLLSFSGHKFHGPKGIGGLIIRRLGKRVRLKPQLVGGGHERGRRAGTLNVPGIVGMAKALEIAHRDMEKNAAKIEANRNMFLEILKTQVPDIEENGDSKHRLYNSISLYIPNVLSNNLLDALPHIAMSSGAACSSTNPETSHVIKAMYPGELGEERAQSTIRIGLSKFNTNEEIESAAHEIATAANQLKELSMM